MMDHLVCRVRDVWSECRAIMAAFNKWGKLGSGLSICCVSDRGTWITVVVRNVRETHIGL